MRIMAINHQTPDMLTVKDAAGSLGISPQMVYDLIDRGDLVAYRFGRVVRVDPSDLRAYRAANLARPKQPKAKGRKAPLPAPGRRRGSAHADLMRPISERGD
jgi:excisionase family DNA binding protein